MINQNEIKKALLTLFIVLSVFLGRPQAYAYGVLVAGGNVQPAYTQVIVSGNRYYYNQGIFYSGSPGNYVAVEAPTGAIINEVPVGYESVVVDGNPYFRYHNTYYRHSSRGGYEVVQNKGFHDQGQNHSGEIGNH